MNNILKSAITVSMAAALLVLPSVSAQAATYSESKDLVVMGPRDLPEAAQVHGNAFLLHANGGGSTYLYIEQQQGARLAVFDVTDPSRIKLAVSEQIPNQGPFDFVRPLGDNEELIYFRDAQKAGVLDLSKAKKPVVRTAGAAAELMTAEPLGETGYLATHVAYQYEPAVARDFQVIDASTASPTLLATVQGVKHRVTNDETGTTFLLGSEGLTVVRRISVENEHQVEELQMRGN